MSPVTVRSSVSTSNQGKKNNLTLSAKRTVKRIVTENLKRPVPDTA